MHIMTVTTKHGVSYFACPACDRRVLLSWLRAWRCVLREGDVSVAHTGGR